MRKLLTLVICPLFLTACGSNPQSYLAAKSAPIVNIDSNLHSVLNVKANANSLTVKNLSERSVNFSYKLFWYDSNGVSQELLSSQQNWQAVTIDAKKINHIELMKPTEESDNYRIYIKP
ncbi:YcfL family protein [Haemophilus parahaemolyticus]